MTRETPPSTQSLASSRDRWLPFLLIIAASALAHIWCLGSKFYMDDFPQIRDSPQILSGDASGMFLLTWTTLSYIVQYKLFGMSEAGFHAVNWLLHTSVACALFAFGRDFIRDRWPASVALFGALLFAVHPLASEIPNYARTQDLAWVTLFSILSGWFMLRFLRTSSWLNLLACALFGAGATFSKGPGIFHAGMACAAVLFACSTPEQKALLFKGKRKWITAGVALLVLAIGIFLTPDPIKSSFERWKEPRFIGHAYTLSRVFWEFGWRSILPVSLSSDHLVTETLIPPGGGYLVIPDKIAMLAMVGQLAITFLAVWLSCRKSTRLFGVCLFLYVATMLFRVLYVIPEFMPEYRIYPGLPWFCLGAAILMAKVWGYLFETLSPRVPAAILLAVFALLSAKRSFVWHDHTRLTKSVLEKYPARARALWEMNDRDIEKGNWQAIIDRQATLWPDIERRFIAENQRLAPAREIPSGDFALAMVAIFGRYARAVAHQTDNPAAGLLIMARLEAHMARMQMTPENKVLEWGYVFHDKGLLYEMAGDYPKAAEFLNRKEIPPFWPHDRERVEKKLAEKGLKPGS